MSEEKLTLTQDDNGKSLLLHPGDEILISLPELFSGGYQWLPVDPEKEILPLLRTGECESPGDAIGAASMKTFLFKAKSPGTRHVQLKQLREWEGDASTIERFDIDIEVRESGS
ncbi:MAG: protease inhibitor I42 family protein [Planctomycetota bacterium]|jgi:predicted secreted protein